MRTRLRDRLLTMFLTLVLMTGGGAALAAVGSLTTVADAGCEPIATGSPPDGQGEVADDGVVAQEGDVAPEGDDQATDEDGAPVPTPAPTDTLDPSCEDGSEDEVVDEPGEDVEDGSGDEVVDDPAQDPTPGPDADAPGEDTSTGDDVDTGHPTDDPDLDEGGAGSQRAAECNAAAGAQAGSETTGSTGAKHSLQQVLANCLKNPSAAGLPNALEHLVANAERKAAHDAAKAAGKHGNPHA